jgi:hypothetical protein
MLSLSFYALTLIHIHINCQTDKTEEINGSRDMPSRICEQQCHTRVVSLPVWWTQIVPTSRQTGRKEAVETVEVVCGLSCDAVSI